MSNPDRPQRWRQWITRFSLTLALLGAQQPVLGAPSQSFSGPGPYQVSASAIEDQGLLFSPIAPDASSSRQWPAVVFAHGLCGPADRYSASLTRLASWGFLVLANQEQADCGVMNVDHPFATLGNLFQLPFKFSNAVDFSAMASTIEANLAYVASRSDVDTNRLALMGHSMGGGMVIDVAAGLALQSPGEVKAVVAIAPWNGVQPTPSSVVSGLSAPLLILCSMSDALCPCSGEVQLTDTQGLLSGSVTPGIPLLFGSSADPTWHGGAMAIFRNAPNAIVMDVDKVSHFTIAGIDDGFEMQDFADWARGATGLNFNRPDRPYNDIPTMEYAVAFLNQALELDRQAGEALLNAASSDARLVDIQRSN